MRIVRTITAVLLCLALHTGTALADVVLEGDVLNYDAGGKKARFEGDNLLLEAVAGSDLRFVVLDAEQAGQVGKKPMLLIFDKSGKLTAQTESLDGVDIEQISGLSLSPGGKVLAVDHGTWLVRTWSFAAYPALKPAAEPLVYLSNGDLPGLAWVSDEAALSTVIDEKGRAYEGYDPGGVISVVIYNLRTGKQTPVLPGTALCDYSLSGFDGTTVTAQKECGRTVEDWATPEAREKGVTAGTAGAPLPSAY